MGHVYFPEGGVFSLITQMASGGSIEVARTGNEGMIGIPVFLDAVTSPARAVCQIPGRTLRMTSEAFREEAARGSPLHALLHRYTQALMTHLAQSVACNRLHSSAQRCARWLLMTHDRVGTDHFPLTQEFLARMLGMRRATVSEVASALQEAGIIHYEHGRLTIEDRGALEGAACECYAVIRAEFDQLLGTA